VKKIVFATILLTAFIAYSGWVYKQGTASSVQMSQEAMRGKNMWHSRNCQNCHQVFGLGGYMGPDLTTVTSDKKRGILFAKAMLLNGGAIMPNFHFTEKEADDIVAYLDYVGNTAKQQNVYP
jgi:nitric oxide reductase subunit C